MANSNNSKRDPIVQGEPGGGTGGGMGGSVANASAGRVKSVSGGGANFTEAKDLRSGFPAPDSPYK